MKKLLVVIWLSLLFITASAHAQSGVKYINAQLDANKLSEANANLSQIDVDFCDKPGEKTIQYTVNAGNSQDICLEATNRSAKDIEVTIWFVDGTVTNDQRKNKACMQQGEDKKFWQYVTWFETSFTVPANNFAFKHATFQSPKWATWIINWCLVYYTKSMEIWGGLNFSVLMRKAKFIDIKVRENGFMKKYLFRILIVLLMIYYIKVFIFSKKHKKLPRR